MATQANTQATMQAAHAATAREAVTALARLIGLAFVISLAVGLLLTAAAVALPAPLSIAGTPLAASSSAPQTAPGEPAALATTLAEAGEPAGTQPVDVLVALAAILVAGLAVKGSARLRGPGAAVAGEAAPVPWRAASGPASHAVRAGVELHCHVGRTLARRDAGALWSVGFVATRAGEKPPQ